MLTKGAIGNLINRYRAVLTKCNLINTFGSLAVASMLVLGGAGVASATEVSIFTQNSGTVILEKDWTHNSESLDGKKVTLDLNGHTIQNDTTTKDIFTTTKDASGTVITIKDSSAKGNGTVYNTSDCAFYLLGDTTLNIQGGIIKNSNANASLDSNNEKNNYATIYINGTEEYNGDKVNINVTGGHVKSETGMAMYLANLGKLTVTGGTIEGKEGAVEVRAGDVEISGGTFISHGTPSSEQANGNGSTCYGSALAISQHTTNRAINVNITGGTFKSASKAITIGDWQTEGSGESATQSYLTDTSVKISGGTFEGNDYALYINQYALNPEAADEEKKFSLEVTGGEFNGVIEVEEGGSVDNFIYGGTFSDESALKYLAPEATITVTDKEIASYANEDGDEHSITFGAEGGSKVESVALADNSSTTFDGKAAITKMTAGEKTTLTINSADISAKESDLQKTEVKASGDVNDALGGAEGLAAQLGTTVDKIGTLNMEEGLISGAVVNGVQKTSTVLKDTLEQATAAPLAVNRILMNDVRKRMGDLRDTKEESGVWMRWDGGKLKGDEGLTNNFNTIQIGADMLTGIKNVRAGVAGSFTHGDVDHNNGDGEMEAYTFAAYGTWMADNGMFADVIARVGFNNTELNIKGGKADLDNEALSLSAEYGWRFDLGQQFFVEPQAELTYTHVTGADFTIKTASYDVDSMDSLIGRAGLAAGWKLPNERGNVYVRASVVHEFLGDAEITGTNKGNSIPYEIDGEDTWLEYGIGANVKLTDNTYVWADVERTEGADIEEEWRGTVGIRYSF